MKISSLAALGIVTGRQGWGEASPGSARASEGAGKLATLFLCGDVMLGRGIDQVLPHPGDPRIHEPYARSALDYVELAEAENGPIPRAAGFSYVWGDALEELERVQPEARIVNLETSVTRSDAKAPKGIHYRMHPDNVPCLKALGVDCCVLANNHVLDWGEPGLVETLETLQRANIEVAGAGRDRAEAESPAILELAGSRRVITFAFGSRTSGIPRDWAASEGKPGVNLLDGWSVSRIAASVERVRRPGDIVIASVHWGGNWGFEIQPEHRSLAHRLVDEAGIDVVHGHSSHHAKAIEVYRDRLILYGCGDFLNDYEGITGHEEFRGDLALMYFVTFDPSVGRLVGLELIPLRRMRFRLHRATEGEVRWLRDTLDAQSAKLGTRVEASADDRLMLRWDGAATRSLEEAAMAFTLSSAAFGSGGEIPERFTCEGEDVSPPLAWSGVPEGTRSLALVVDDPDAPDPKAPRTTWVHWVLYDLPPTSEGLEEAVAAKALPPGARQGRNDWKRDGYGGPCPPIGRHRYFFKLYALDKVLGNLGSPTKARLLDALEGHVLARAELVGTYQKKGR